jgi:hypothetical protein
MQDSFKGRIMVLALAFGFIHINQVQKSLVISGLFQIFEIYPWKESATESVQQKQIGANTTDTRGCQMGEKTNTLKFGGNVYDSWGTQVDSRLQCLLTRSVYLKYFKQNFKPYMMVGN